jgi:K+-transporting ATPase ATPase B chain
VAFSITALIALLVCLIPTTIGGLLSAIGIAGMDRLLQRNVLAMSGRAVEAAGDIDVLLLDKTGTITLGNRMASEFIPPRASPERSPTPPSSPRWPTKRPRAAASSSSPRRSSTCASATSQAQAKATFVPFTAQTRMSGVDLAADGGPARSIRKGAAANVKAWVESQGASSPPRSRRGGRRDLPQGGTPLVVAEDREVLGVIFSRTSSRAASRSASPSCGPWASAPS